MKTKSRTIIYTVKEQDKILPLEEMNDRSKFVLYKLSYFKNIRLTMRYITKEGIHYSILSITELADLKNKEDLIAKYIVDRIILGIPHNLVVIHSLYLCYPYEK